MDANANGWSEAPIEAPDEAKTGRLREEGNDESRPKPPVPFGLLPKTPIAALRRLAEYPDPRRAQPSGDLRPFAARGSTCGVIRHVEPDDGAAQCDGTPGPAASAVLHGRALRFIG